MPLIDFRYFNKTRTECKFYAIAKVERMQRSTNAYCAINESSDFFIDIFQYKDFLKELFVHFLYVLTSKQHHIIFFSIKKNHAERG